MVDVAEWFRRNTVNVVYARSNRVVHPYREVEEWFISPASGVGVCRFESGLPDKVLTEKVTVDAWRGYS